jgi:hypothetical protein
VAATRNTNKRTLALFCVNRSLTDDAPVEIDLGPFCRDGDGQSGADHRSFTLCHQRRS